MASSYMAQAGAMNDLKIVIAGLPEGVAAAVFDDVVLETLLVISGTAFMWFGITRERRHAG
jgi:hypothetical protein